MPHQKSLRLISTFAALFFILILAGGTTDAQAAKSEANDSGPRRGEAQAPSAEERLESLVQGIETDLDASADDDKAVRKNLKTKRGEIDSVDKEIRRELAATRKKLKDAKLPAEILQRHEAFSRHYENNIEELRGDLDEIEGATTPAASEAARTKLRQHRERTKAPVRQQKLDPNNLPHRQPKAQKREPRQHKEEFERDLKKDKNAWRYEQRIRVAAVGSLAGLLSATAGGDNLPTAYDLSETIDVQFTPAIKAKALELNYDPVKIYEWVRNNIEYTPTYGSIQGADQCLKTKQGNDIDTASLLIALLRTSGIHARYAYGTIELPIAKAMSWIGGMSDPAATVELLASAGIPIKPIVSGGTITELQLEHAWVEAWIDYNPSRGARHKAGEGDTWIPLDASFKHHRATVGLDFATAVPFDTQTYLNQLTGAASINEVEGYATNVQCAAVSQYQQVFRAGVQDYLAAEQPGATVSAVLGSAELVGQNFPYLLGTLPYQTLVKGGLYSELPASLRHTVTFELINNDPRSVNYSETTLSQTMSLPKLAGKRITLSYSPATAADEAVVASYAPRAHADGTPISFNEFPASLPAYLVQVKAELRVDGVVVASGLGAELSGFERFRIRMFNPNLSDSTPQELFIKAGEYVGIALGSGPVSQEHLQGAIASLAETKARLQAGNLSGLTKDDILGGFLHASALASLAETDTLNSFRAQVMGIAEVRRPSSSAVTLMLSTTYFFGLPRSINVAGPSNAELGYRMAIAAKDGNRDKAQRYLLLSGLDASVSASAVQEYLLSTAAYPVTSVSAVKAMKTASERAIPLYRITPDDSASVAGKLQLTEEVEQAIANDAVAGLTLIAPRNSVTFGAWSGVGYEAIYPPTGNNYTNLNGPPNLVQGMPGLGRSILLSLLPSNALPPAALASAIVTDEFIAGLGGVASGLADLPSQPASAALDLLTTSLLYDRLGEQLGCYLDLDSPSVATGDCMATYLSLLCTASSTPLIADQNTPPVADAGADQMAGINETVTLDGSRSVDADNTPLTYQWRLTSVPAGSSATLNDATSVAPSFTADVAGVYSAELSVSDGKKTSLPDSVTISAYPAVVAIPSVVGLLSEDAKSLLKSSGLSVGAIDVVTDSVVAAGRVTSQNPAAGINVDRSSAVSLIVSTGSEADTAPPLVSVSLDLAPALYVAGATARVAPTATDAVGIATVAMTVDGSAVDVSLPETTIDTTGYAPGSTHTIEVTAQDLSGNSATATATFGILDPNDTVAPQIAITSPVTDGAITAPVEIVGSVVDNNLFAYTLAYAPAGKSPSIVFASGNRSVTAGVLGRLDPSLMQNGLYDVLLTAVDANGNTTTAATRYRITGDLKVGNFTVAFTDLSIPLAGIPVSVTRSYDSRSKQSGDFGVGWSIDIQSIKIEENSNPGENWGQTSSGGDWPTYCVGSEGERYVAITLPDGKVEEFDLTVTPKCRQYVPIDYPTLSYTARPGTTSTLQAQNVGLVYYSNSGVLFDLETLEPYNPTQYLLTTVDGTTYAVDQTFGVKTVTDTNSNVLTYGTSGITHSSGKSVSFSRDGKGRITQVTDPSGKAIRYSYDISGNLESVTDPAGNVTRYTYNSSHGLIDIVDPLGRRAVRNEYDNSGRLTAHIDAEGQRIEYSHDIAGRQEAVKDRNGHLTVYVYDNQGRVLQKTDPLGKTVAFTYDNVGNKLSETDPLGNVTTWTYDGKKNVLSETRVVDGQSIVTRTTYNSLGKVLTSTDAKGNVTTNTYDTKGNLLSSKDALGNITTNNYDTKGNLLTVTDPFSNITRYAYDGYGNLTKQTGPTGALTSYAYDGRGNKVSETDPLGRVTRYGYDANSRLTSVTDALGNVTRTEYDKAGNKVVEINPLGHRTTYAYDSANRLNLTTYADGTTTASGYDREGNVVSRTDAQGRATRFTYNASKQLIRTDFADGTFTTVGYDAAGRQISSTDANGQISTTAYDNLGRVASQTDADGHTTHFEYDLNGNQTKQIDANGHATVTEYDAANRPVKVILPGGQATVTAYDSLGRKISETDAADHTTQFGYDAEGRLTSVTDALNQVTRYEYDAIGNKTAIVDAKGHRTTFAFDALGRLSSKTMPNGGVESYSYDAAGRQIDKTDAKGQTITYAYDNRGRLLTRSYPDNGIVTFAYTVTGQRDSATDHRGAMSYYYDLRNRLTQVTMPDGRTLDYTYDPSGRIASIASLAGTIGYRYSPSGRLTTVIAPDGQSSSYSYDAAGNRTGLQYPNGAQVSYGYDVNNRLTSLTHQATVGQIAAYSYTLGAIGNRTKIDEASGISRQYEYDQLYRLTQEKVVDPSGAQSYTTDFVYDAVGNRLSKTNTPPAAPVVATDYSYNAADQLVSENGVTYTYDLNGSLTSRTDSSGTTLYRYDYDNRMVEITGPAGTATYAYDVDGNRVEIATGATTIKYLVDTNRSLSQVVAEYQPDNTLIASYVYADDLISLTRGSQTYWYHFDGLGSTRLLTDSTGAVTDTYNYDAFGNLIAKTGTTENTYLFTGQQYDANSGLYHLRARYYQPSTGTFTALDPWDGDIYAPATLHKYLYTANDPVNKVDLNGKNFTINDVLTVSQVAGVLINSYSFASALMQGRYTEAAVNVGFLALDFTGVGMLQRAFTRLGSAIEARVLNQSISAFRDWGKRNQIVRLYYKSSFAQAKNIVEQMVNRGHSIDDVAREAYRLRQAAQQEARLLMDAEELAALEIENLRKFGNKVGPSFEQLLNSYKGNYEKLIESSFKSNRAVNALFLIWY